MHRKQRAGTERKLLGKLPAPMTLLPFALLLIVAAIAWFVEAPREAKLITQNMGGKDLDHSELMWRRLLSIGSLALLAWYLGSIGQPWQNSLWPELRWMLACCAIAWASFVFAHRFRLNSLRGKHKCYIAPSNWTDRLCMLPFVTAGVAMLDAENWTLYHRASYLKVDRYTRDVHRGGLFSYIAIALVLAASIVGVVAILN
jgi:hypothetical protein